MNKFYKMLNKKLLKCKFKQRQVIVKENCKILQGGMADKN